MKPARGNETRNKSAVIIMITRGMKGILGTATLRKQTFEIPVYSLNQSSICLFLGEFYLKCVLRKCNIIFGQIYHNNFKMSNFGIHSFINSNLGDVQEAFGEGKYLT